MCIRTMLSAALACFVVIASIASAQDDPEATTPASADSPVSTPPQSETGEGDMPAADEVAEPSAAGDAAAASNPLSSTSKLDLRFDYFDLDGSRDRFDINVKGDFMLHPRVKFVYEAHYWSTDVTGQTEDDWERVSLKPIFFLKDARLADPWKLRVAAGAEWILDADNADKGIGSGSDQIAPLFGLAFNNSESGLTLIPLVQHFVSYDGPSVNTTAFRLIALQPLPQAMWLKLDAKVPFDWQNDTVPVSVETELGKMLSSRWGVYGTGFLGVGGDRQYEWGLGAAVRFRF